MKVLRWILCLPAAVVAYVATKLLLILFNYSIFIFPRIFRSKVPLASFTEWNDLMQSTDMQGDYITGTLWLFLLSFMPAVAAIITAMICAPAHKKTVAVIVTILGSAFCIGLGVLIAMNPYVEHTFSFWYRQILAIVATMAGFGFAVKLCFSEKPSESSLGH